MSEALPPGFVSIATALLAADHSFHSVIGVTVRPGENPYMTRKGDYMVTFSLADSAYMHQQPDMRGLMIRFFRPDINSIPLPQVGDLVVLRNVKKQTFQGSPVLLSHHSTSICIFAAFDVPQLVYAITYSGGAQTMQCVRIPNHQPVTVPEQMYAIWLKHDMASRLPLGPPGNAPTGPRSHTTPVVQGAIAGLSRTRNTSDTAPRDGGPIPRAQNAASNRKFSLIKDLVPNKFSDMVVEVIKIFSAQGGGFVELQVSDYTEHHMLYDHPAPEEVSADVGADGDPHNYLQQPKKEWPGPYGQRVLQMEIHYPHAAFINTSVKEGDFVHMRNARAKIGQSNKLQGNLWPDTRWPDRIDVSLCKPSNSVECEALVSRRTQYWDARPRNVDPNDTSGKGGARKKAKAKKAKQKKQESATFAAKQMLGSKIGGGNVTNPNVRCASGTIQLSSLADMIAMKGSSKDIDGNEFELPFVNQKRRARVRVIDYYPKALEDFSYFVDTYEHDIQKSNESDWQPHYEWDFFLRLEDAPEHVVRGVERATMWVHVTNDSAQYLLKTDPVDLRPNVIDLTTDDVQPLTALEEKLFLLWGNLKEVVTAEPGQNLLLQNPPFECCIREFGQELDDADRADQNRREWIRVYEMFGVTIN